MFFILILKISLVIAGYIVCWLILTYLQSMVGPKPPIDYFGIQLNNWKKISKNERDYLDYVASRRLFEYEKNKEF